jgi:hypothetical protein
MKPFDWTCPFCNRPQIVSDENFFSVWQHIENGKGVRGSVGLLFDSIICRNEACRQLYLAAMLTDAEWGQYSGWTSGKKVLEQWRLLPESSARPQPEYIPQQLRDDYVEACRIRDLSPKASATLARRCLQGMIRDFCKISKGRLIDEIKELENRVDTGAAPKGVTPESVEAIDHVRKIGNIGAHMESDVNLIIEIEPDEAQVLIELIETLFDEWYVERQARSERLAKIAAIRAEKDALKSGGSSNGTK